MIRETAVKPDTRKQQIQDNIGKIQFNQDPVLTTFGVQVETKMHEVSAARVLPPPTLVYAGVSSKVYLSIK